MSQELSEQDLFAFLLETIPDEIYFKDRQGRFMRLSDEVARKFGVSGTEEVIGKSDYDFLPKAFADEAAADERRIMETGCPMVGKIEKITDARGRVSWGYATKVPLRNHAGEIIGICGINKDFNAVHAMEEALRSERNRLLSLAEELQAKNAQMAADLEMAKEVQQALLPQAYPRLSGACGGFEFAHDYRPAATVSGDFFDFFQLSPTRAGLFVCDVMGHGVRASLITMMIRGLLEELRPAMDDPGHFLQQLNAHLCTLLKNTEDALLATAFYVVFDADRREILFANAGHPQPVVLRAVGRAVENLGEGVAPQKTAALGLFRGFDYRTCRCVFGVGERIVLFTDGLFEIETAGGEEFGRNAVVESLNRNAGLPARRLLREVLGDALCFAGRKEFEDDVCLISIERKG
ncbi:MAG: SpoIIE family protein phosphatase [Chthoniobacteraceae bacterium]